jgi:hypothetical protein
MNNSSKRKCDDTNDPNSIKVSRQEGKFKRFFVLRNPDRIHFNIILF